MSDAADTRGRVLVPTLIALMGAWLFAYVYAGASVIPMWDGWIWIWHAKAYSDGGFRELVRNTLVHGQHLYLLPSAIALILGPLVEYSFRPFSFLCVILLIACAVVFYRLARRNGLSRLEALVVFLTVASFRHHENLLSGFQIGFPLCVLLGAAAVIVADARRDLRGFALALALAVASALSSSAGILAVIVIVLVRWFDPMRLRNWILVGIAAVAMLLLVHITLTRLELMEQSVVAYELQQLTSSNLPVIFEDGVMLLGGGLVAGATSTPVGLLLLAFACGLLVTRVRRTRRIDALSGLMILSISWTVAIAIARAPIGEPSSRHAIFAAPLVCVCVIELFGVVHSGGTTCRAACGAMIAVGLTWLCIDAVEDARGYRIHFESAELESRTQLARVAGGAELTDEEIGRMNPGPPQFIRSLMNYMRERRLSTFSADYHGFDVHDEFPTNAHGVTPVKVEVGMLCFAGPGHVYDSYACPFPSGCNAFLSVDLAVTGAAAIGIIVRRADGTERENINVQVPSGGAHARHSVRAAADAGETLEPYAYAVGPDDVVRIESFSFVMVQKSQIP